MSNLQNRNPNNREVPPNGNSNNVGKNVAYRDGYVHGRASERRLRDDSLEVRDNNNAARGLLIGVALTSLVGLALAALFLLNRRQEEPVYNPAPVVVPQRQGIQSPEANQSPQPQTTVIQRTIERVPQVITTPASPAPTTQSNTAPAATTQSIPRVNVTVPPQPAPRVTVTVPPQTAPRVNVTVPPQTAPRVNVTVPPQPTTNSSPNTTINVVPNQPQNGANTNTNNSAANGANTNTAGTTQRSATSGSGTVNVTPNTTGNTGTNNTTGNTGNNPNNTGTTSRISTQ